MVDLVLGMKMQDEQCRDDVSITLHIGYRSKESAFGLPEVKLE